VLPDAPAHTATGLQIGRAGAAPSVTVQPPTVTRPLVEEISIDGMCGVY